jgi:hypothetical protein
MPGDPARHLAARLHRHGLATPARLFADAHRPLGPLVSDLGVAFGPLARAIGGTRLSGLTGWLEEPRALDRLVAALDAEGEPRAESG